MQNDPSSAATGAQSNELRFKETLSEAWELTSGVKATFWQALAIVFIISFAINFVGGLFGNEGIGLVIGMLVGVVGWAANAIFGVGIQIMGIKRARGEEFSFKEIFEHFDDAVPLVIAAIIVGVAQFVGFILLVIPGLYIVMVCMFVNVLIVEQKMSPIDAIKGSFALAHSSTGNFFTLLGIVLVMGIIIVVSAIPLGIGLIWTLPMAAITFGVMYRELSGSAKVPAQDSRWAQGGQSGDASGPPQTPPPGQFDN